MLEAIFSFLTGIGILLFGVQFFGNSLEKMLGANLRKKLNKFVGNRFSGCLFGTISTFALQSSSASTAMFVGFAGAGIITLYQSISLIIGSNIGSALSAFILIFDSINVVEILASLVFVGVLLKIFAKNNNIVINIGNILIGLGVLFGGLILISSGTSYFKTLPGFIDVLTSLTNPFLLILISTLVTCLLQSTSGIIAIIITLMATATTAGLDLTSASYLIYGTNIGTCITAVLVSLNTNTDGKRVAWAHVIFNVIGTIIFTIITLTTPWLNGIKAIIPNEALQIMVVNLIFNVVTSIVLLPLISPFTKLMKVLVRRSKKEIQSAYTIRTTELETPTLAIKKLNFSVCKLAIEYSEYLDEIKKYILVSDVKNPKSLKQKLKTLSNNADKVYSNTIRLSGLISNQDQKNIIFVQNSVNNFKDILKNYQSIINQMVVDNQKIKFDSKKQSHLKIIFENLKQMFNLINEIFDNFYNENLDYNCEQTIRKIIEISVEISKLKTQDKKEIVSKMSKMKEASFINFLNITNKFNDLKNSIVDIAINSIDFFNTKSVQLELNLDKEEV